jgi:hypothetical protein
MEQRARTSTEHWVLHHVIRPFEGIGAKDHSRIFREEWPSLPANQETIRDATWSELEQVSGSESTSTHLLK